MFNYSVYLFFKVCSDKGEYQPGCPGRAWTDDEVDKVRLKVLDLLSQDKVVKQRVFGDDWRGQAAYTQPVTEMSMFRLSFHDCFKYTDGTGGCDGCLNWHNMENDLALTPSPFKGGGDRQCMHQFPRADKTDNNGLDRLVRYLEKIYTETDWPAGSPVLDASLKATGKSRADFWQFATNVALEKTIARSNHGCRYDYYQRQQVPLLEGVWSWSNGKIVKGPGFPYGVWKCKIKLNKPLKFQFGRKDCIASGDTGLPYETAKEEAHSNPHGNADEILSDAKNQLDLSATDMIALTSIHGMIHPFSKGSIGTKYAWLGSGPHLSNIYYKMLANRPTYDVGGIAPGLDMRSDQKDKEDGGTLEKGHNLFPYSVGDKDGKPVAIWGMSVS